MSVAQGFKQSAGEVICRKLDWKKAILLKSEEELGSGYRIDIVRRIHCLSIKVSLTPLKGSKPDLLVKNPLQYKEKTMTACTKSQIYLAAPTGPASTKKLLFKGVYYYFSFSCFLCYLWVSCTPTPFHLELRSTIKGKKTNKTGTQRIFYLIIHQGPDHEIQILACHATWGVILHHSKRRIATPVYQEQ